MPPWEPSEEDRRQAAALVGKFPAPGETVGEWRLLQDAIEDAIRNGEQGFLFALHEAAAEHPLLQGWPRRSAWRAAGQISNATALRRFLERAKNPPASELPWGHAPRLSDGPARQLGAMLAYAHPDELLDRELEHFGPEPSLRDLFACWIQERVMRGSAVGRSSFVRHFWSQLPPSHPLYALPLELRPLEDGLLIKSERFFDLLGNWFTYGPWLNHSRFEPEGDWQTTFTELDVDSAVLAAVASDPALCPNSTFEGRVFALGYPPSALSEFRLRSLPLQCLDRQPVRVRSSTPREVLSLLLMLGTGGGAYGEAPSAAFGRLLAWRSLRALVGLPEGAPLQLIEAMAERTGWLRFESDSSWFNHVSLDVGLVALRPDGLMAVLAITDTD